jgi:hypothetical protein
LDSSLQGFWIIGKSKNAKEVLMPSLRVHLISFRNWIFILIFFFFLSPFALAQDNKPFDTGLSKLSQNYQGADFVSFHQKYLAYTDRKKSEFETLGEYQKRMKTVKDPIHAFSVRRVVRSEYDAEARQFQVLNTLGSPLYKLLLDYIEKKSGSYEAQTAGGARARVEVNDIATYELRVGREVDQVFPRADFVKIPCPPEKAKQVKLNLSMLCLCRPIYSAVEKLQSSPTFNEPRQNRTTINYLESEFVGLWFFDRNTGEILWKKSRK